jgi:hypothetical protein
MSSRYAWEGCGARSSAACEDFVELVHEDEFELVADSFGTSSRSACFRFGNEDALDAGAVGGERLFFVRPADGRTRPAQRELARHRHVVPHADAREQRDDGGEHRDEPAEGPSFGMAPAGDVDVDVALLEKILRDAVAFRRSWDVSFSRPRDALSFIDRRRADG